MQNYGEDEYHYWNNKQSLRTHPAFFFSFLVSDTKIQIPNPGRKQSGRWCEIEETCNKFYYVSWIIEGDRDWEGQNIYIYNTHTCLESQICFGIVEFPGKWEKKKLEWRGKVDSKEREVYARFFDWTWLRRELTRVQESDFRFPTPLIDCHVNINSVTLYQYLQPSREIWNIFKWKSK